MSSDPQWPFPIENQDTHLLSGQQQSRDNLVYICELTMICTIDAYLCDASILSSKSVMMGIIEQNFVDGKERILNWMNVHRCIRSSANLLAWLLDVGRSI